MIKPCQQSKNSWAPKKCISIPTTSFNLLHTNLNVFTHFRVYIKKV